MKNPVNNFDQEELVKRCRDLRGLVRSLVCDADRAADIEQRVWLKALQASGTPIHAWRSWCRTVTLNLIRGDARKKSSNILEPMAEDVVSTVNTPEQILA